MKQFPFDFILDRLLILNPTIKRMFGCWALYIDEKIFLIVRDRQDHPEANGVWVATSKEFHTSLHSEIPGLTSVDLLTEGKGESNWQMLSKDNPAFEELAMNICDLILRDHPAIGRVPAKKKKRIVR